MGVTIADLQAEFRSRAEVLRPYAPPAATAWEQAAEELERLRGNVGEPPAPQPAPTAPTMTWQERLWIAPPDTRIGCKELREALGGKSKSWLYELTSKRKIPFRKNESGELVFVVGEIRAWLRRQEVVIVPGELAHREVARLTSGKE